MNRAPSKPALLITNIVYVWGNWHFHPNNIQTLETVVTSTVRVNLILVQTSPTNYRWILICFWVYSCFKKKFFKVPFLNRSVEKTTGRSRIDWFVCLTLYWTDRVTTLIAVTWEQFVYFPLISVDGSRQINIWSLCLSYKCLVWLVNNFNWHISFRFLQCNPKINEMFLLQETTIPGYFDSRPSFRSQEVQTYV